MRSGAVFKDKFLFYSEGKRGISISGSLIFSLKSGKVREPEIEVEEDAETRKRLQQSAFTRLFSLKQIDAMFLNKMFQEKLSLDK